jgi:hypothetical protein
LQEDKQFDQGCDRNSLSAIDTKFNGDYISLLGGYTNLSGLTITPATKFCGVYTGGVLAPQFPGASCKYSKKTIISNKHISYPKGRTLIFAKPNRIYVVQNSSLAAKW